MVLIKKHVFFVKVKKKRIYEWDNYILDYYYTFFLFSSNHCSVCQYFFITVIFYSINYAINKKIILLSKQNKFA